MKKTLILFICLLSALSAWTQTFSYSYNGAELIYEIVDETQRTCKVTGWVSYADNVTIPSSVVYMDKFYTVVGIGSSSFNRCTMRSITFPHTLTSIDRYAFERCNSLTSIDISSSVTTIGEFAFYSCTGLSTIDVDKDNPNYSSADGVFFNKEKTILYQYPAAKTDSTYEIPASVTYIYHFAFYGSGNLTSVMIPESVTSIGRDSYYGCSALTSLTLPNSITSIGSEAFSACSALSSVSLSESLTEIPSSTFYGCSELRSVTIPNSVSKIGMSAFNGCSSLTSLTIPDSVTEIGGGAFAACSSLTSLTIGKSVASIGFNALGGCSGLTSITVPNSLNEFSGLHGCENLEYLYVEDDNPNYVSIDGIVFSKDMTLLAFYPAGKKNTSYEIPASVTAISDWAFFGCGNLTTVTIPGSVTAIGPNVFYGCRNLASVTIPNSVKIIGTSAFQNCSSLRSISIPDSVSTIDDFAFGMSGLTSVTIPGSVTTVGIMAFISCKDLISVTIPGSISSTDGHMFASCNNLEKIYYDADEPISILDNNFIDYNTPTLYVKKAALDKIKATAPWNLFSKIETYDTIDGADYQLTFTYDTNNLTTAITGITASEPIDFVVPEYVEHDGLQYKVTEIGRNAFYSCDNLKSVTIPASITKIANTVFNNCGNLETVYYNAEQANSGEYAGDDYIGPAFRNCPRFKNLVIGETVRIIPDSLFWNTAIESVDIPDNVEMLSNGCFAECYDLKEIRIGKGIRTIENGAFALNTSNDASTRVCCDAAEITGYGTMARAAGNTPFRNRPVSIIEFGPDVCKLGNNAFMDLGGVSDIYCRSTTPPEVGTNALGAVDKSTCRLCVPTVALFLYKAADFWKDFYNVNGDVTGIGKIPADDIDADMPVEVYNLTGVKVSDSIDGLNPGVYVIRQGSRIEKIIIR